MKMLHQPIDQSRIVEDGFDALVELDTAINEVLAHKPDLKGHKFGMHGENVIRDALQTICNMQARAYGCLFDEGSRGPTESKANKDARLERVRKVKAALGNEDLPNLRDRGIRNALAHYDEYYLNELRSKPKNFELKWLGVSSKGMFTRAEDDVKTIYVGVYFYAEDEFHLFNRMIKLIPMQTELRGVVTKAGYVIKEEATAPGDTAPPGSASS
ncbi:hypothetical protein [Sphingomonas sp. BK235]|uniref:hypothetical protein n=1 Tax=Sphingomonas sp. BK235 TaxID=2512131 RepID=UPI00104EC7D0|nr:hypothetical protein [Sphingomonas sp. BK235]